MNKAQFLKKINEVKEIYSKIYTVMFTYGRLIMTVFFSLILLTIFFAKKVEADDNSLELERSVNSQKFINRVKEKDNEWTLKGPVSFGQYEESGVTITSFSNLLYYKGFIIPRFFSISKTAPFQSIDYFNKGTYTIEELDTLFKNIFTASNKNFIPKLKNISFPIKSIAEDFKISCFLQPKIIPTICDSYVSKFLDSFFIYSIDIDSTNFTKIMEKILQDNEFKEKACKGMMYYTYYNGTSNETIKYLMKKCPDTYQDEYSLYMNFLEVEGELFNKFISNKIYKENEINIYKLISYQQIINDDINNKMIDVDRINRYFSFLQELLRKDKLSKFYKELCYYFNNYYIRRAIEDIEITNKIPNNVDIDNIAREIIDINNGNILIGYSGLKEQVNKNILREDMNYNYSGATMNYEKKIEILISQIPNLEARSTSLSGNNIHINGIRKIKINNQPTPIPITLNLEENNNNLYIKKITFEGYEEVNTPINNSVKAKPRTFFELQKYLEQNIALFNVDVTPPISKEDVERTCKEIRNTLTQQDVKECDNTQVVLNFLRKNKITTMTILHYNFSPEKFDINNPEAKKLLDDYLEYISKTTNGGSTQGVISKRLGFVDNINFASFIKQTLETFPQVESLKNQGKKTEQTFTGSTNIMIIIERFEEYLKTPLLDVVEKDGKILTEFEISGIGFLGYYNIKEHKIYPMYIKKGTKTFIPIMLRSVALTLTEAGRPFIKEFTLDPLAVIKKQSPQEYLLYIRK